MLKQNRLEYLSEGHDLCVCVFILEQWVNDRDDWCTTLLHSDRDTIHPLLSTMHSLMVRSIIRDRSFNHYGLLPL